jgi:hypothetical protein
MGAGEHDLRLAGRAGDVEHVGLDPVARTVGLGRDLLAAREDRLGPVQVDDDVALLEAPDDAGDELALPVLELVEGELALGVADLLDDDLLRGLGRDAAELGGVDDLAVGVADLPALVLGAGVTERDLDVLVLDLLDDRTPLDELDLAELRVVLGLDVLGHAVLLLRGSFHRGLEDLDDHVPRDVLFLLDGVDQSLQVTHDHGDPSASF